MRMNDYFGSTDEDAFIKFELNDATRKWDKNSFNKWRSTSTKNMSIKGLYEGSVIFGTRFRNTSFHILKQLDRIENGKLSPADDFIKNISE